VCNPRALRERPDDFYGFFLEAARRYEATPPHSGYAALARLCARPRRETLVVTSNVDRALERSGIDAIAIHGNAEVRVCVDRPLTADRCSDVAVR
jgi:NAD-dependent SIR2 family protein deacetylase